MSPIGSGKECPIPEQQPVPPAWASHSTRDEDGVVHELASPVEPAVQWRGPHGWLETPSTVLLSTIDVPTPGGWQRLRPTVQIEGGKYTLDSARRLRDALNDLITRASEEDVRTP